MCCMPRQFMCFLHSFTKFLTAPTGRVFIRRVLAIRRYSLIFWAVMACFLASSTVMAEEADQPQGRLSENVERVVIDPGHGGEDIGVTGPAGLTESRLTLALARQLKIVLEDELGVRVFLTRTGDENPSLYERTALVNRVRGHIFISLHAGGAAQRTRSGFGVFFQDYSLQKGLANRVSLKRPAPGQPVEWALAQGPYLISSRRLAGEISQAMSDVLRVKSREVMGAPLVVLAGAARPAVLVEVGYLTNPEEERRLLSQAYRDAVIRALVQGIDSYQAWVSNRLQEGVG